MSREERERRRKELREIRETGAPPAAERERRRRRPTARQRRRRREREEDREERAERELRARQLEEARAAAAAVPPVEEPPVVVVPPVEVVEEEEPIMVVEAYVPPKIIEPVTLEPTPLPKKAPIKKLSAAERRVMERKREELKAIRKGQAALSTQEHLIERKAESLSDKTIKSASEGRDAIKEIESYQGMVDDLVTNVKKQKTNLQAKLNETNTFAEKVFEDKGKYTKESFSKFERDYNRFVRETETAIGKYDKYTESLESTKKSAAENITNVKNWISMGAEEARERRIERLKVEPSRVIISPSVAERRAKRAELAYVRAAAVVPAVGEEPERLVFRRPRSREEVKGIYKRLKYEEAPTADIKTLSQRQIEEALERGELDPLQVTQYFVKGEGQFAVITPKEEPGRTVKGLVSTWITRANWAQPMADYPDYSKVKLGSVSEVAELLGPSPGRKIWELSPTERDARLNHVRYSLGTGLLMGAVATVNPKTYVDLAKDAWGFVKDPYGSTGRRSRELKAVIRADPEGFFYQLSGSLVSSYLTGMALGKIGGAVAPGVKSAVKTGGQKLYGGVKSVYKGAQSRFMDKVQGTWLDELIQAGKVSPDFVETRAFTKGPPSVWDEFRSYMKTRSDFVDITPEDALKKPGMLDEFRSYMKTKTDFIQTKPFEPGKLGMWDEFTSYFKTSPDFIAAQREVTGPPGLLAKAKIWWRLHQAKMARDVDDWLQPVTSIDDLKVGGAKTPWYKTGMGMADMPYPSKAAQGSASRFFNALSKEGVEGQVQSYYGNLINKGISASRATEMASNYGMAVVALETAKAAKTTSSILSAIGGISAAIGASASIATTSREKNAVYDMIDDMAATLRTNIATGEIRLYPSALKLSTELQSELEKKGTIDEAKYEQLLNTIFKESGLTPSDVGRLDVDEIVPIAVKPLLAEEVMPEVYDEEEAPIIPALVEPEVVEIDIPIEEPVPEQLQLEVPVEPLLFEEEEEELIVPVIPIPAVIQELTVEQIQELTTEQIQGLTPTQVGDLTPEQLTGFTPRQLRSLIPRQIHLLTSIQLSLLTLDQVRILLPELTLAQLQGLSRRMRSRLGHKFERVLSQRRKEEKKKKKRAPLFIPPQIFRVTFQYRVGDEYFKEEARSFREAHGKANRKRALLDERPRGVIIERLVEREEG